MKKRKLLTGLVLFASLTLASCNSTDIGSYFNKQETNKDATISLSGVKSLYVGEESRVYVSVTNSSFMKVSFTSSDDDLLSVDNTGLIKALKAGTATVTASLGSDVKATLDVTIKDKSTATFDVRFVDYDGTLLYETSVKANESAVYVGNEPKRASNFEKSYVFKGWDKDFSNVTSDLLVTATYEEFSNTDFVFTPVSAGGEEGYMLYYYLGDAESITIPNSYQGKPVTKIDSGAFTYAENLKSITLPNSISELGDQAFYNNTKLEEIYIPDSVYEFGEGVFLDCKSLKSVRLPEGITILPESTFSGCKSLTEITLPSTVVKIGEDAFEDCESLVSLKFANEDSLTSIDNSAFSNTGFTSFTLPKNVKELGTSVFDDCAKLTSFTWNNVVDTVGRYFFDSCTNLVEFKFTDALTTIGNRAFYNTGLKTVVIPDTVTTINDGAFVSCIELTSVTWSKSVTSIPNSCFDSCAKLVSLSNIDEITKIGSSAFYGTAFNKVDSTNLLKSKVTSIGSNAFFNLPNLTEVTIPGNVKTVDFQAFRNNLKLEKVTIEEGVTKLGDNVFAACPKLEEVVFPSTLVEYGSGSKGLFSYGVSIENINLGENVTKYKSVDGVVYTKDLSKLVEYPLGNKRESYKILDEAKKVNDYVFAAAQYLKEVDFNKVTEIGRNVLADSDWSGISGSSAIEKVKTPETLEKLSSSAFANSKYLKTLDLSLSTKLATVPSEIAKNCKVLESATLPNTITKINSNAFNGCTSLKEINLPKNIKSIGNYAFKGATNLVATYDGTKAEFLGLGEDAFGYGAFESGAIVRCSDADIVY